MTAPKPNAELAYRVLDHNDAHPEQWEQGLYIGKAECGTVACFAGWAVLLSGELPAWSPFSDASTAYIEATDDDGELISVPERAEQLLGGRWAELILDEDGYQVDRDLFDGDNDREELGLLVAEIFGPRPEHCGYGLDHPPHGWTKLANDERPDDQPAACPGGES